MSKINNGIKKIFHTKNLHIHYCLAALLFIVAVMSCIYWDSDGYFLLATGKEIATNGIPHTNPFFLDNGYGFVAQQWLWALLLYGVQTFCSWPGLFALTLICLALDMVLIYKIAKLHRIDSEFRLIACCTFGLLIYSFVNIRPTLITIMILLLEIYLLELYRINGNKKALYALPLIGVLMANIHASMIIMVFLVILCYVFPAIRNKLVEFNALSYKRKPIILATLCTIPCIFVNPYGIDSVLYLFHSVSGPLRDLNIIELQTPGWLSITGLTLAVILIVSMYFIYKKKAGTTIDGPLFYLFVGTFLLGIDAQKHLSFAVLGFIMFLITLFENYRFQNMQAHWKGKRFTAMILGMLAVSTLSLGILSYGVSNVLQANIEEDTMSPIEAVEYLDKNASKEARIYTTFNTGAYLEYNGYKSFIDARPELFFKGINHQYNVIEDAQKMSESEEDMVDIIEKYDFEYLLVYSNSFTDLYLKNNEKATLVSSTEEHHLYEYEQ